MKSNRPKNKPASLPANERKDFLQRLKIACDMLLGNGYFELFPPEKIDALYRLRYPFIQLVADDGLALNKEEIRKFKIIMTGEFGVRKLQTLTGAEMPFNRFLSEGLLLIHYAQYHLRGNFVGAAQLYEAFSAYFTETAWYQMYKTEILGTLAICALYFYEPAKGMVWVNTKGMALVLPWQSNMVQLSRVKVQTTLLTIDGKTRSLFRLCVPYVDRPEPLWLSARPSLYGFEASDDQPRPLYIQQHALNRFHERTSLPAGLAQVCINIGIVENELEFHARKGYSLVEFKTGSGHKLGYFVMVFDGEKLIIRTFLFLTNEGTPEGQRLKELTHMGRLDTGYLKIDRLTTFMIYDIGSNPQLRELFTEAGCQDLLELAGEYSILGGLPLKSPEYIHDYLSRLFLFGK